MTGDENMQFSEFSNYLTLLDKTSARNEMTVILAELFKKLTAEEIDKAVYLLQGKVTPQYEPEKFNLADKTIIKAISFAFNKTAEQITNLFKNKGDLGEVVYENQKSKISAKGGSASGGKNQKYNLKIKNGLSINNVYQQLLTLTTISGAGTIDNKMRLISGLLQNLDPASGKYLVRIILDKMRLGFSDATILDAFSWMLKNDKSLKSHIEEKYNIHPDLGLIGKLLKEKGERGLKNITIEPGCPVLMAKCERCNSPEEILEHGEKFGIEDKYDGFRLQIHICQKFKVQSYGVFF